MVMLVNISGLSSPLGLVSAIRSNGTSLERLLVALRTEGPDVDPAEVQLTGLKLYRMGLRMQEPDAKLWPDSTKPVERVGKSILLFYSAPQSPVAR